MTPPAQPSAPSLESLNRTGVRVKIIGVGGGGTNAVDRLRLDSPGAAAVPLAVVNTDLVSLEQSPVTDKIHIGRSITRGLGCGGDSASGRAAAEADRDALRRAIEGLDLVFILSAFGGGAGSGAAPVLAEVAAECGVTVISFVSLPFSFEGSRRTEVAEKALREMREWSDALVALPNDLLCQETGSDRSALEVFAVCDGWIRRGVEAICSLLFRVGLIHLDFASLRQALGGKGGRTLFAFGSGGGTDPVAAALESIDSCPLLHLPENQRRAESLLVNITGGPDLSIDTIRNLVSGLNARFGSREQTFLGATLDEGRSGEIPVVVIGTTDLSSRRSLSPRPLRSRALPHASLEAAPARAEDNGGQFQSTFDRLESEAERGLFGEGERNFVDGVDLDVPTFIRKGIKIRI